MKNKLIEDLINCNCIKIGNFKLKNGEHSKYYYDIKNIISYPKLLMQIGDELFKELKDFDIICGIPYGAMPIASYISTKYNKPMIYIRDKAKKYGTEKLIEGEYNLYDRCVIIDDVITTGNSLNEVIDILKDKINIIDIAVVVNRQQDPNCKLPFKSLIYKNDIVKYRLNKISLEKKSNLCFAADINDSNKIMDILEQIGKYIVICKIHYDIIDDMDGLFKENLICMSKKHNFLIMEDRKFNDISHIVSKQYAKFSNWVDMVTVHSLVSNEVISKLSGVLIVANMSNNDYDYTDKAIELATQNQNCMIGFITQKRINCNNMICMTPGISLNKSNIDDQKYRSINDVDTDYIIVGRSIYNSNNIIESVTSFIK